MGGDRGIERFSSDRIAYGLVECMRETAPDGVGFAFDAAGRGGVPDVISLAGDPALVATIANFGAAPGVKIIGGRDFCATAAPEEAATLCEAGRLELPIAQVFSLSGAAEARCLSEDGHTRGKIILVPDRG